MGKPAARATLDTGAHSAPILTGSLNVFTGSLPAARQGDPITCPSPDHATAAIITGGSKTVFINGLPAARMGDETGCGAPPPPSVAGPPVVPPSAFDDDPFKKRLDEELDKNRVGDKGDNRSFSAAAAQYEDADQWGAKAEAQGATFGTGEKKFTVAGAQGKGEVSGKFLHGEADVVNYKGNGKHGGQASASATVAQVEAKAQVNRGGTTVYGKATGKGPSAEANAGGTLLTGPDKDGKNAKYGFELGGGAGASALSGSVDGGLQASSGEYVKASVGGDLGAVGASAKLAAYYDADKGIMVFKGGLGGKLGIGALGDVELGVSPKALLLLLVPMVGVSLLTGYLALKFLPPLLFPIPPPVPGTILTGCPTVLIGG